MKQLELFPRLYPPSAVVASYKAALHRYYSDEGHFNFAMQGEECVFPDGTPRFSCSNWATYVRRIEGPRAKLYGFDDEEFEYSEIANSCGGHDFAVVGERFVVDGWLFNVEGTSARAVLDLRDEADEQDILRHYGPPSIWLREFRNIGLEHFVDRESPEDRAAALAGVAMRPAHAYDRFVIRNGSPLLRTARIFLGDVTASASHG